MFFVYLVNRFYAVGLVLVLALMFLASPEAHARSGTRVCVDQSGQYAFAVNKGRQSRKSCERGLVHTDNAVDWGWGRYMTCEAFGRNYLDWDYSPCYEMKRHRRGMSAYFSINPDNELHRIVSIPRDFAMKSGGVCGAGRSCSLGVNAGRATSFGYQAGFKMKFAEVYEFNLAFTTTDSASAGWSYTCTYSPGQEMGMRIEPVNTNRVYSAFNYNDLFDSTDCFTRRFSHETQNKRLALDACRGKYEQTHDMYEYIGGERATSTDRVYLYPGSSLMVQNGLRGVSYGIAKEAYDELKTTKYNHVPLYSNWYGLAVLVYCGPSLDIATGEMEWRGGGEPVKWRVSMKSATGVKWRPRHLPRR